MEELIFKALRRIKHLKKRRRRRRGTSISKWKFVKRRILKLVLLLTEQIEAWKLRIGWFWGAVGGYDEWRRRRIRVLGYLLYSRLSPSLSHTL